MLLEMLKISQVVDEPEILPPLKLNEWIPKNDGISISCSNFMASFLGIYLSNFHGGTPLRDVLETPRTAKSWDFHTSKLGDRDIFEGSTVPTPDQIRLY